MSATEEDGLPFILGHEAYAHSKQDTKSFKEYASLLKKLVHLVSNKESRKHYAQSTIDYEEHLTQLQFELASIAWVHGNLDETKKILSDIIDLAETVGTSKFIAFKVKALMQMARRYYAAKKLYAEALEALNQADKLNNDESIRRFTQFYIGFYSFLSGNYEKSKEVFHDQDGIFSHRHFKSRAAYWYARSIEEEGKVEEAQGQFLDIFNNYPLDYYGHRSYLRLKIKPKLPRPKMSLPTKFHFEKPASWSKISQLSLDRALELSRLGLVEDMKDCAVGVLKSSPPEENDVDYIRFLGHLLFQSKAILKAYILLGKAFPSYTLPMDDPLVFVYHPRPHFETFSRFSKEYKMDKYFMLAMARQESAFEDQIISGSFGYGILQVQAETGEVIANELGVDSFRKEDLLDPKVNIRFSAYYAAKRMNEFGPNGVYVSGAYNIGAPAMRSLIKFYKFSDFEIWIENIPVDITNKHVRNVVKNRANYYLVYENKFPNNYFSIQ